MNFVKTIIFLVSLLLTGNLQAQSTGRTYNALINLAELKITDGRYSEALQQYETAFTVTKTEFAVDLYNASVCAAKLKNTAKILDFADRLANKGVGKKFFDRSIFKNYQTNSDFRKIIAKAEAVKNEKELINRDYQKNMNTFFSLDSTYNQLRQTKYHYQLPDTLQQLFLTNTKNLLHYIANEGFYSEDKLGAQTAYDTIIKFKAKPDIVFLHYLEMGTDNELIAGIKNLLLHNLNAGFIKQYHIAATIELTNGIFGDTGNTLFNINNCSVYRRNDIENGEIINHYRNLYCMDSLADFEKKITFKYSRITAFDFRYTIIKSHIPDEDSFHRSFSEIAKIKNCQH